MKALIGYTGFVGSNINLDFTHKYNSKNIQEIRGKDFDVVVCAGLPAEKWKANQNPERDKENIQRLIGHLMTIKAKHFVLISTIDAHNTFEPYGEHRLFFENWCKFYFEKISIIRLPGLFGKGLKKNIIFDILNKKDKYNGNIDLFQWYNLNFITNDIKNVIKQEQYGLHEWYSESVSVEEISKALGLTESFAVVKQYGGYHFKGTKTVSKKDILLEIASFGQLYGSN